LWEKLLFFIFIHGITQTVFVYAVGNAKLLRAVLGSVGTITSPQLKVNR